MRRPRVAAGLSAGLDHQGKYPESAFADARKAEAALNAAAKTGTAAAYSAVLADDGRVVGSPAAPAMGRPPRPPNWPPARPS
uniref:Uncharacterized protein n=1 Tax=Phenylobacterium glaciei TaxID=2803784 RepID=A0A974P3H5_9CAUL|nr:hypothetical protein JKL49_02925 [Phenylobacterium glaciei]